MKDEIKVKVLQERLEELKVKWAETESDFGKGFFCAITVLQLWTELQKYEVDKE